MKPLAVITALLALAAAPALAGDGQIMRDPQAAYRDNSTRADRLPSQCFNGRMITGVNRLGETTYFVQARTGVIYELTVPRGCPAMDRADKILVTSSGGDFVCKGEEAEMFARISSGSKRCFVSKVRQLERHEIDDLAKLPVR